METKKRLNFENKSYISKFEVFFEKTFFFANFSNVRKIFEEKNSTSKLIFIPRNKKIHFEVDDFYFEVKIKLEVEIILK